MPKKQSKKQFTCPYCKVKQDSIGNSCEATLLYRYDIQTEEYLQYDTNFGGDNSWYCLECDHDLTYKDIEKLSIF